MKKEKKDYDVTGQALHAKIRCFEAFDYFSCVLSICIILLTIVFTIKLLSTIS